MSQSQTTAEFASTDQLIEEVARRGERLTYQFAQSRRREDWEAAVRIVDPLATMLQRCVANYIAVSEARKTEASEHAQDQHAFVQHILSVEPSFCRDSQGTPSLAPTRPPLSVPSDVLMEELESRFHLLPEVMSRGLLFDPLSNRVLCSQDHEEGWQLMKQLTNVIETLLDQLEPFLEAGHASYDN